MGVKTTPELAVLRAANPGIWRTFTRKLITAGMHRAWASKRTREERPIGAPHCYFCPIQTGPMREIERVEVTDEGYRTINVMICRQCDAGYDPREHRRRGQAADAA